MVIAGSVVFVGLVIAVTLLTSVAGAQEAQAPATPAAAVDGAGWAFLGAAISVAFGCLGAGIAVAYVGAAAVGAVAEKPQLAARTLIFVGLAEGIAIYGLIIAIMILGKV
jgi:V/A-type H+/Na+-transporting ATPase subunit K